MTRAESVVLLVTVLLILHGAASHAQTVKFLAVGPSSVSDRLAIAVVNSRAGPNSHHWTGRAELVKEGSREKPRDAVLWVVWSSDEKRVWAYLALDPIPGVRSWIANPRGNYRIHIDSATTSLPGQNKIANTQFKSGDSCQNPRNGETCDAGSLPTTVGNLLPQTRASILDDQFPHCGGCCTVKCGPFEQELQQMIAVDPSIMRAPGEVERPIETKP
jgi:hypothetical protein